MADQLIRFDHIVKRFHVGTPGGCVNGGGQPIQPASVRNTTDLKALRAKALYDQDAAGRFSPARWRETAGYGYGPKP